MFRWLESTALRGRDRLWRNNLSKITPAFPLWRSRLRIQKCLCSSSGHYQGTGSIFGPAQWVRDPQCGRSCGQGLRCGSNLIPAWELPNAMGVAKKKKKKKNHTRKGFIVRVRFVTFFPPTPTIHTEKVPPPPIPTSPPGAQCHFGLFNGSVGTPAAAGSSGILGAQPV